MNKNSTEILMRKPTCCKDDLTAVTMKGELIESRSCGISIGSVTENTVKPSDQANPLLSEVFCADPTAVEYEGRLYVYGTNDHQQFDAVGAEGKNTYEQIKSLVMLSTEDMVNWTYHGIINVGEISPWAYAAWAPSVVSRVEQDGKTHFYLYYSNSGWGIGVLTSTSPTGPWTDPLGRSIIDGNTEGLNGCKTPFDPGVVIDDNGVGWLSFGGGENSARIVRLCKDMISLDSEMMLIPSEHHYEASELNFINGTYVYTYNNDWNDHSDMKEKGETDYPPACSMCYLTTTTPLISDSWKYRGYYFANPGAQGLEDSNNHTHLQKYCGEYYLFYHSVFPQKKLGTQGGFRSLCVNRAEVSETAASIGIVKATKEGVSQIKPIDPFSETSAATHFSSSGIKYVFEQNGSIALSADTSDGSAAWVLVKGAAFTDKPLAFAARVKGRGRIEVRADSLRSPSIASVEFDQNGYSVVFTPTVEEIGGTHDLYFVISNGAVFDRWQFVK